MNSVFRVIHHYIWQFSLVTRKYTICSSKFIVRIQHNNQENTFGTQKHFADANPEIRDFSGRRPNQYETSQIQTSNKDNYSEYSKKLRSKHGTKHHSFLRKSKNFTPNQRLIKSAVEAATNTMPVATAHSRFYGSYNISQRDEN